jgi:chromate transporter
MPDGERNGPARGTPGEVLGVFLRLGLTSFGGPIAHLAYFREELVARRKWLDEAAYADLVALCQFLPGPASSQVGFALGLRRAGFAGAAAAWAAFTLPSAIVLAAFALGLAAFSGPAAGGALHGLKLVAVAVVAQAVWGMSRTLAPDRVRATIAAAAVVLIALAGGAQAQVGAIVLGAIAGWIWCREGPAPAAGSLGFAVPRGVALLALAAFVALLVLSPLIARLGGPAAALFDAFYRAGALVFGGGHVVLPLLEAEVVGPGWVDPDAFLAGYGAAQAVPGPLFTFAAFLGAIAHDGAGAVAQNGAGGVAGAAIALVAVFLPGLLLVVGALPFWDALRLRPWAQGLVRGANAAVVGVLAAALYDPVWTSAVRSMGDFAFALTAFVALVAWRAPPWSVVAAAAAGGALLAL